MKDQIDIVLTSLAPLVWGSTYYVTTQHLPEGYPLTMAALRALPAGLLLLVLARQLPRGVWWVRVFALGALNFTLFWALLFLAAYRLPGGVAATVGAVQPLIVVFLASAILRSALRSKAIVAAAMGVVGVSFLVLGAGDALDTVGLLAGLAGAVSMAAGTVLTRKWQPPVSLLTFTAWQLTAGGLLLVPLAIFIEPPLPPLELENILGISYLSLIGAALTYILWFRGISHIGPTAVSALGFLSPLSAVLIGWIMLGQAMTAWQIVGAGIVLSAVWLGQHANSSRHSSLPNQSMQTSH
ncbi:putative DMT superfamily transporter inner membrane protein [Roseovarius albus]|uniref:Putative DMT superfamily transporter inner membrane protein n=1 Tax=Roseovarius albus TaxID=1247867 RepID=A0A1X6ZMT0_9RHOB|nr:DMT family transporter [Roseovarius albus]SLN55834.1 putative DMT superfamily transporter inner membrane protein [Roseovarius albus]